MAHGFCERAMTPSTLWGESGFKPSPGKRGAPWEAESIGIQVWGSIRTILPASAPSSDTLFSIERLRTAASF